MRPYDRVRAGRLASTISMFLVCLAAAGCLGVTLWDEHQIPVVRMPSPYAAARRLDQLPPEGTRNGPIVVAVGTSLTDAANCGNDRSDGLEGRLQGPGA